LNRESAVPFRQVFEQLQEYCAARQWRGYDPFDGLNSPLARLLPGKTARQAWIQFHRRSPVNLRPLCGIAPTLNPKSLALFAMGSRDEKLLDQLGELRSLDGGWGYPFDWQSRAFFAPRGTFNLICTVFVIRAYRELGCKCDAGFIEGKLLRERNGERWFTYIPQSDTQVHNVNMIGAALLGRRDCMEFSVHRQRDDGSWWYGEAPNQRWTDNFHTAYCVLALNDYEQATSDRSFSENMQRAYEYWDRTFWTADYAPRYYDRQMYPFDIHCSAVGIVTYLRFGERQKAHSVAQWAIDNMWDRRGFFWYQRGRWLTNRICYMRWSQAWMYYALAQLLK
jgi:hypothetical protein